MEKVINCRWLLDRYGLASGAPTVASGATKDGWIVLSDDLAAFQKPTGQWFMAGDAHLNPQDDRLLVGGLGRGVLVNGKNGITDNLITREEMGRP